MDRDLVRGSGDGAAACRVVGSYGITVYSSGGFDSLTVKYDAAKRIGEREVPTVILHVGDFDPSGLALFEAAAEDVAAFAGKFEGEVHSSGLPLPRNRLSVTSCPPRRQRSPISGRPGTATTARFKRKRCRQICSVRKSDRP
jgi:hypothetical protein